MVTNYNQFNILFFFYINYQKKKKYKDLLEELNPNKEYCLDINKENYIKDLIKINNSYRNNIKSPIFIFIIWFILTFIRFLFILETGDKIEKKVSYLNNLFILYAFFSSFRGIFYYLLYFKGDYICCDKEKYEKEKENFLTSSDTINDII